MARVGGIVKVHRDAVLCATVAISMLVVTLYAVTDIAEANA